MYRQSFHLLQSLLTILDFLLDLVYLQLLLIDPLLDLDMFKEKHLPEFVHELVSNIVKDLLHLDKEALSTVALLVAALITDDVIDH